MKDVILHYDVSDKDISSNPIPIPTTITVDIGSATMKLYLSMCYWRPDSMTYHLEYRQMEE